MLLLLKAEISYAESPPVDCVENSRFNSKGFPFDWESALHAAMADRRAYSVQFKDDPTFYEFRIDESDVEMAVGGESQLEKLYYRDASRKGDVIWTKGAYLRNSDLTKKTSVETAIELVATSFHLSSIILIPRKKFAHYKSRWGREIILLGHRGTSKADVERLAQEIVKFDDSFSRSGFYIPKKTTVFVGDRKNVLPDFIGPHAIGGSSIFRIGSLGFAGSWIAIVPVLYNSNALDSSTTVFHERGHNLLKTNFEEGSWLLKNDAIEEGFADFFAAHFSNDSNIKLEPYDTKKLSRHLGSMKVELGLGFLRDLASRREIFLHSESGASSDRSINGFRDLTNKDDHFNSLAISSILWKFRQVIGQEKMQIRLHGVLHHINRMYPSYQAQYPERFPWLKLDTKKDRAQINRLFEEFDDNAQSLAYDVEFLLAALWKIADPWPEKEDLQKVLTDFSDSVYGLSAGHIEKIANQLKISPYKFESSHKSQFSSEGLKISGMAVGIAGVVSAPVLIPAIYYSSVGLHKLGEYLIALFF